MQRKPEWRSAFHPPCVDGMGALIAPLGRQKSVDLSIQSVQYKVCSRMIRADYISPHIRRFSCMMMSLTAAMTNLICIVSVAHVKWVQICLVGCWLSDTKRLRM